MYENNSELLADCQSSGPLSLSLYGGLFSSHHGAQHLFWSLISDFLGSWKAVEKPYSMCWDVLRRVETCWDVLRLLHHIVQALRQSQSHRRVHEELWKRQSLNRPWLVPEGPHFLWSSWPAKLPAVFQTSLSSSVITGLFWRNWPFGK